MDSDPNPHGADLIPSKPCADAKRLRCSAMPSDHVSKVLDEDNTSSWSAPVPPLDDENLLQEILLRVPPKPSSLPRASLVCTRWRTIISDPQFLGRFRKHHRKPPLLGFFIGKPLTGNPVFTPVLKPPDCIPSTRFSVPESCHSDNSWLFNGCRHGLAPLVSQLHREIVVWDPLTGQHHRVTFPPGLDYKQLDYFQATVLCADAEDGHVHGDCFLSPFKLVFICAGYKTACGSLYDSVSGVWGNIVSVAITQRILMQRPHILVRNALCLLISGGDVLAFDFERQRLDVIEKPADAPFANSRSVQVLRTEDGGLGFAAALSELTIKLWERRSNCDGVVGWVLLKTILLEGLLPRGVQTDNQLVLFVGYDEDTNMILLSTMIGYFTLQLDSMLVSDIMKRKTICFNTLYTYRNFYAAARAPSGNGWIWNWACVDAKRPWSSALLADPVSKVLDDDNTSSRLAPAHPLEDENLLQEILLRLPPKPSSLPRASLVCTSWRSILSDLEFLKRFRRHNRMPPLLGFFAGTPCITPGMKHNFIPVLDRKSDCIPAERFAVPKSSSPYDYDFLGCRHGLAVLISECKREVVVWDPITGQQHHVPFPPELRNTERDTIWVCHAAVLCVDAEDGHVHGDCFSSPFKLALTCVKDTQAFASLYESASGVWGNIVSTVTTSTILMIRPSILIGSAVYWLLFEGDILVFDTESQTLSVIEKPADARRNSCWSFQLLRIDDDSGLGLAVMSELSIQLWKRKSNSDGVIGWVMLQKIIQLEGLFPREMDSDLKRAKIVGYDEDSNVIVLATYIGDFMLQLDLRRLRIIS